MSFHLAVISDFGDFKRGDKITDAAAVLATLAGENAQHTLRLPADPHGPRPLPEHLWPTAAPTESKE